MDVVQLINYNGNLYIESDHPLSLSPSLQFCTHLANYMYQLTFSYAHVKLLSLSGSIFLEWGKMGIYDQQPWSYGLYSMAGCNLNRLPLTRG